MSFEELLEELRKGYLASMPDKIANIERLWEARELQLLETEYHSRGRAEPTDFLKCPNSEWLWSVFAKSHPTLLQTRSLYL
jgi:hypothetical protein